jgi:hypothetical protein
MQCVNGEAGLPAARFPAGKPDAETSAIDATVEDAAQSADILFLRREVVVQRPPGLPDPRGRELDKVADTFRRSSRLAAKRPAEQAAGSGADPGGAGGSAGPGGAGGSAGPGGAGPGGAGGSAGPGGAGGSAGPASAGGSVGSGKGGSTGGSAGGSGPGPLTGYGDNTTYEAERIVAEKYDKRTQSVGARL